MANYVPYAEKSFQTRGEAEEWANKIKQEHKDAGLGVIRKNIVRDVSKGDTVWIAKLLIPVEA